MTQANGKLLSAMLSAAMAARADASRFGRGRAYVRDGSVTSVRVVGGELSGEVLGSRRSPYEVMVRVPTLGALAFRKLQEGAKGINDLVPGAREMKCSCSCPDDVATCKHAVAVVLAFAEQVAVNPDLIVEWRGGAGDGSGGTDIADLSQPITRPRDFRQRLASVHPIRPGVDAPAEPKAPALPPAVAAFLGYDVSQPPTDLPTLPRLPLVPVNLGDVSLDDIVDEALGEIRAVLRL